MTFTGGCKKCGLIGCSCSEVTDTFNKSLCKKCSSHPCECSGVPVSRTIGDGVCVVCRRRECQCQSHVGVRAVMDLGANSGGSKRPYSDAYTEILVNEGLNHYYARDAEGLAKWLRRVLR